MKDSRKISKNVGVEKCCEMMASGIATKEILRQMVENYGVSVSTVEKWMKDARPKAEARQKEAEEVRLREMGDATVDALKQGLKSDLELEVFLCRIAAGDISIEEMIGDELVIRGPSPTERTRAIEQLWKKRGSYAPTKSDVNVSGGITLIEDAPDDRDDPIN